MIIRVVLSDRGGLNNFVEKEIRRVENIAYNDTKKLATECEKIIQETIMTKSRMPTGNLASNFTKMKIDKGWGVGDIDTLYENAPYWNHIDKGSEAIGADWSHYLPRGYWNNGRWIISDKGFFGVKPKSPIPAMNYIASTIAKMDLVINRIIKRNR